MNLGRRLAYDTFRLTLSDLLGREGITEVKFRNEWLVRLRDKQQLSTSGWYEPPPYGMGVLFGHDASTSPFSHASLRPPENWPSERVMKWGRGLMYAYCHRLT
jgi:hypothetical protein